MNVLLAFGGLLLAAVAFVGFMIYTFIAIKVFHRFRARHLEVCPACKSHIKDNLAVGKVWNFILCGQHDVGAYFYAAWWLLIIPATFTWKHPVTGFARLAAPPETRPQWLITDQRNTAIRKLEMEKERHERQELGLGGNGSATAVEVMTVDPKGVRIVKQYSPYLSGITTNYYGRRS